MLLVILGAGASMDSLDPSSVPAGVDWLQSNIRHPLAKELFAPRSNFTQVLRDYEECVPLISQLRPLLRNGSTDVEQFLESRRHASLSDPRVARQLMALQFYIREVIAQCDRGVLDLSAGTTNYSHLIERLEDWRLSHGKAVCLVTFNYDGLLDHALETQLGMDLRHAAGYLHPNWKLIKLHGSVRWGRRVTGLGHQPGADLMPRYRALVESGERGRQLTRQLIPLGDQLDLADEFAPVDGEDNTYRFSQGNAPWVPAISIPLRGKTSASFQCPSVHLDALRDCLKQTQRVLVLGWRGAEGHFLEELRQTQPPTPIPVEVVDPDETVGRSVVHELVNTGFCGRRLRGDSVKVCTFTDYLTDRGLEGFLESKLSAMR